MKNADATRKRILEAATSEFAAFGIAGGRVDRIARSAAANKNLIYVYFGSKELLFGAVLERHLGDVYESVLFTPEDLPGYAARLFDFVMEHPQLIRLLAWWGLEQKGEWPAGPRASVDVKLKGLRKAQREGWINGEFTPAFLLAAVIALCNAWTAANPLGLFIDPDAGVDRESAREAVARAVARICGGTLEAR